LFPISMHVKTYILRVLEKPEKVFVAIGLIWGILFVFITPPFQAPDENWHLYRAFHISEGNIKARLRPDIDMVGGYLPRSLKDVVTRVSSDIPFFHYHKQKIKDIISALSQPLNSYDRIFVNMRATDWISLIPYLPQALGILLGRIFNPPVLMLMYLGRLFNLFFWILIMHRAIKIIPVFKGVMLLLALMPMSLFLAASLNADALTDGIYFLLAATFLRYTFDKNRSIAKRDLYIIFLLSALAALAKPHIYLFLLFLLIPGIKFGSKGRYLSTCIALFILGIMLQGIWTFAIRDLFVRIRTGVYTQQHIAFMLFYPLRYLAIMIKTLYMQFLFYVDSFIGRLGWLDTPSPLFLVISYYFVLTCTALLDSLKDVAIGYKQRIILFITVFVGCLFIFSSQYIYYTPIGDDIIEGIQGRYFIPLSPAFFLLFYNRRIRINMKYYTVMIAGYSVFVLSYTLVVLICRYYLDPAFYRPFR